MFKYEGDCSGDRVVVLLIEYNKNRQEKTVWEGQLRVLFFIS